MAVIEPFLPFEIDGGIDMTPRPPAMLRGDRTTTSRWEEAPAVSVQMMGMV